jgi:diguanylate cyclase (GGDEF)-like protein
LFGLSLRTKLIITLSVLLLSAFLATNIINYNVSKHSLHTSLVQDSLPIISNNIYSEIQRDLIGPVQVSSLMSNDTFVKDWLLNGETEVEKIQNYLREIRDRYQFDSAFLVSAQTKNYYHFNGIHKVVTPEDAHDVWYYSFVESGVAMRLDIDTDEAAENRLTIFINHRLTDANGQLLGVTGVGLSMNKIGEMLESYRGMFDRVIYLIDKEGVIQIHPDIDQLKIPVFERNQLLPFKEAILQNKNKPQSFEFDNEEGHHILLITRYIPEFDLYLMVEQDESRALEEIRTNLIWNLVFGLLISLLIILLNIITVNYFQRQLERMATSDPLTGLANRRVFWDKARSEFTRSRRCQSPLSVLMIDLDHFKRLNDTYGHLAGDEVLKEFAKICQLNLREYDTFARFGGEEFTVILPETEAEKALIVANRLRSAVEAMTVMVDGKAIRYTISIGVSQLGSRDSSFDDILLRADDALYTAKRNGRNRVIRG